MKRALVYGAGGFMGGYLVKKLKEDGIAQIYAYGKLDKKGHKEEQNS